MPAACAAGAAGMVSIEPVADDSAIFWQKAGNDRLYTVFSYSIISLQGLSDAAMAQGTGGEDQGDPSTAAAGRSCMV